MIIQIREKKKCSIEKLYLINRAKTTLPEFVSWREVVSGHRYGAELEIFQFSKIAVYLQLSTLLFFQS
jgi:hypothetical protein